MFYYLYVYIYFVIIFYIWNSIYIYVIFALIITRFRNIVVNLLTKTFYIYYTSINNFSHFTKGSGVPHTKRHPLRYT